MNGGSARPSESRWSSMTEEWNAGAYHEVSDPQFTWGMRVLARAGLRERDIVLDAGCGSGRLTSEIARRAPHGRVFAVDRSENMVRAAADNLRQLPSPPGAAPCDVVNADLCALPFLGTFDIVFSTATFHWILDHDTLFRSLYGVLRPAGRLEAQCGGGPNLERITRRARDLGSEPAYSANFVDWSDPWYFADCASTEHRLRIAGFTNARCWLEAMPTRLPSADAYRRFVETVVLRPFLGRLPSPELRTAFLDRMTAAAAQDDPPFTLDYWRLNISAAKG